MVTVVCRSTVKQDTLNWIKKNEILSSKGALIDIIYEVWQQISTLNNSKELTLFCQVLREETYNEVEQSILENIKHYETALPSISVSLIKYDNQKDLAELLIKRLQPVNTPNVLYPLLAASFVLLIQSTLNTFDWVKLWAEQSMDTTSNGATQQPQNIIKGSFCPECGSNQYRTISADRYQCSHCNHKWFGSIGHEDAIRANLAEYYSLQQKN